MLLSLLPFTKIQEELGIYIGYYTGSRWIFFLAGFFIYKNIQRY